ncbi:hypothetical protein BZA05DRAFT_435439 [Tricharina praecox]|uniref:uncharacterized protein n=1 Tax=Tricharina praecox TaxID=43433 RepID=UPI00221EA3D9|nr:uncharacterized protein BZA05DRAFT_435439 [Tricharina praecox]KAI5854463.1 hypothetical protein BZA05DRAFT_435439 [Tricharina praecox]
MGITRLVTDEWEVQFDRLYGDKESKTCVWDHRGDLHLALLALAMYGTPLWQNRHEDVFLVSSNLLRPISGHESKTNPVLYSSVLGLNSKLLPPPALLRLTKSHLTALQHGPPSPSPSPAATSAISLNPGNCIFPSAPPAPSFGVGSFRSAVLGVVMPARYVCLHTLGSPATSSTPSFCFGTVIGAMRELARRLVRLLKEEGTRWAGPNSEPR